MSVMPRTSIEQGDARRTPIRQLVSKGHVRRNVTQFNGLTRKRRLYTAELATALSDGCVVQVPALDALLEDTYHLLVDRGDCFCRLSQQTVSSDAVSVAWRAPFEQTTTSEEEEDSYADPAGFSAFLKHATPQDEASCASEEEEEPRYEQQSLFNSNCGNNGALWTPGLRTTGNLSAVCGETLVQVDVMEAEPSVGGDFSRTNRVKLRGFCVRYFLSMVVLLSGIILFIGALRWDWIPRSWSILEEELLAVALGILAAVLVISVKTNAWAFNCKAFLRST